MISAINYCHSQDICHRDLKTQNFLLAVKGDINTIKMIDFGLAKKYKKNEVINEIVGTPYFVAPEVLEGVYSN